MSTKLASLRLDLCQDLCQIFLLLISHSNANCNGCYLRWETLELCLKILGNRLILVEGRQQKNTGQISDEIAVCTTTKLLSSTFAQCA